MGLPPPAGSPRAARGPRTGKSDIAPDANPQAVIQVLVELYGPDDVSLWAEEIGRQIAGEDE